MVLSFDELFDLVGAEPADPRSVPAAALTGVNTLPLAGPSDLCFAEHADQLDAVRASGAGAVIVPEDFPPAPNTTLVRTPDPRRRFFEVAQRFVPDAAGEGGIHPRAVVDPSARLSAGVTVGPSAVVAGGVRVGEGTVVGAGTVLEAGVQVGDRCLIESNVTIQRDCEIGDRCILHSGTVIGGDGFGFEWDGSAHRKIPQLGRVVIEDDVEIGCNCCVDRATLGETRIQRGTKIDNLVQIGHNTSIGPHVILVSQAGVAGSSRLGAGVVVAGQVAISDHLEIGAGARLGGQAGVTKDVPAGATMFGTPARPMKDTLRELAALAQLPALMRQMKRWGKELNALQERLKAVEQRAQHGSDGR